MIQITLEPLKMVVLNISLIKFTIKQTKKAHMTVIKDLVLFKKVALNHFAHSKSAYENLFHV